ncbi:hypothetical protein HK102_004661 [Quaeritorhiza haematococci]|nr:hypothetical protein HK102_004661 [Quaeritorhiza haematococci]
MSVASLSYGLPSQLLSPSQIGENLCKRKWEQTPSDGGVFLHRAKRRRDLNDNTDVFNTGLCSPSWSGHARKSSPNFTKTIASTFDFNTGANNNYAVSSAVSQLNDHAHNSLPCLRKRSRDDNEWSEGTGSADVSCERWAGSRGLKRCRTNYVRELREVGEALALTPPSDDATASVITACFVNGDDMDVGETASGVSMVGENEGVFSLTAENGDDVEEAQLFEYHSDSDGGAKQERAEQQLSSACKSLVRYFRTPAHKRTEAGLCVGDCLACLLEDNDRRNKLLLKVGGSPSMMKLLGADLKTVMPSNLASPLSICKYLGSGSETLVGEDGDCYVETERIVELEDNEGEDGSRMDLD